jgi:pyruvate kinase
MLSMGVSTSPLSNIGSSAESTEPSNIGAWNPQLTKIVATIGPTSEQLPVLQDVVRCGMRVMRLNFSHATTEEVELRLENLNQCEGRHGAALPGDLMNVRAVLLDTRGPEIRMG